MGLTLLTAGMAWPARAHSTQQSAEQAQITVHWNYDLLSALGVNVTLVTVPSGAPVPGDAVFHAPPPTTLELYSHEGAFSTLAGGALTFVDGFLLAWPGGNSLAVTFTLEPDKDAFLRLVDANGLDLFYMDHAHTWLSPDTKTFLASNMDLRLSESLATRLGFPGRAGLTVGTADLDAQVTAAPTKAATKGLGCQDHPGVVRNLVIDAIDSLSEWLREPGGRVVLAPAAQLSNQGTSNVPWFRAIAASNPPSSQPIVGQHPYLAMNFYREAAGRFEQIGRSDVKHAFYAVNFDCPCSGGQTLHPECSDRYGAGNNVNQFYFGPRDELTAHLGAWVSSNSHFDAAAPGDVVDDFRSHFGTNDHDSFDHRLVVWEPDLQTTGANFYIECWYITEGETSQFDNIGYRRTTPALNSNIWDFTLHGDLITHGPAVDAWVDPTAPAAGSSNTLLTMSDGHLQLATRSSGTTPGWHHYEYALMNLDFDRQISSLCVPLVPGVSISNITFGDADRSATNDWKVVLTNDSLKWYTGSGTPETNGLDWGTLFNFGFDANAAPGTTGIVLGVYGAGGVSNLIPNSLAPAVAADLVVSKTTSNHLVTLGATVSSLITVSNRGPAEALDLLITDTLPGQDVAFLSASPGCSNDHGVVTCSQASLAPGGFTQFVVNVTFTNTESVTAFTNVMSVASGTANKNLAASSASVTVRTDHDGDGLATEHENLGADADGDGIPSHLDPDETFDLLALAFGGAAGTGTWHAVSGAVYQLQSAPLLDTPTDWQPEGGPVTAESQTLSVTLTNIITPSRYFRALWQAAPE